MVRVIEGTVQEVPGGASSRALVSLQAESISLWYFDSAGEVKELSGDAIVDAKLAQGEGSAVRVSIREEDKAGGEASHAAGKELLLALGTEEDRESVFGAIKNRRMSSKATILGAIKKDSLLRRSFVSLAPEEEQLFYRIHSDRIRLGIKSRSSVSMEGIVLDQHRASNKAKALFILSNRLLLKGFLLSSMTFSRYFTELFSGFIYAGSDANEADERVLALLKESSGAALASGKLTVIDRLNIQSLISTHGAGPRGSMDRKSGREEAAAKASSALPVNPGVLEAVAQSREGEGRKQPGLGEKKQRSSGRRVKVPEKVSVQGLAPDSIEELRQIAVPVSLLRRIREVSRLVAKSGTKTEEVHKAVGRIDALLKEEARRKMTAEDGEFAIAALHRILPSRFIDGQGQ